MEEKTQLGIGEEYERIYNDNLLFYERLLKEKELKQSLELF